MRRDTSRRCSFPSAAYDNRVLSGFDGFRSGFLVFPRRILHFIQKVENNADSLRPASGDAGMLVHDNLLDELIHNRGRQFGDVNVLSRQGDKAVKITARMRSSTTDRKAASRI